MNSARRRWSFVWLGWLAYFASAEWAALRSPDRESATLSAMLREALGVHGGRPRRRRGGQFAFAVGVGWLARHLWHEAAAAPLPIPADSAEPSCE